MVELRAQKGGKKRVSGVKKLFNLKNMDSQHFALKIIGKCFESVKIDFFEIWQKFPKNVILGILATNSGNKALKMKLR